MPYGFTDAEHSADVAEAVKLHGPPGAECWRLACAEHRTGHQLDQFLNDMRQAGTGASQRHGAWDLAKIGLVRQFVPEARNRLAAINEAREAERTYIRAAQEAVVAFAASQDATLQARLAALDGGR
jgi:hypothetical protein